MTKKRLLVYGLVLVFLLVLYLPLNKLFLSAETPAFRSVSLVIRGKNNDSWAAMRNGAELASEEYNIELNYVELAASNDAEDQLAALQLELDAGVEAIVLAAVDDAEIQDLVDRHGRQVPIVTIESGIDSPAIRGSVLPDNVHMGQEIAREALRRNENVQRVLIAGSLRSNSVKDRKDGVAEILDDAGISYTVLEQTEGELDAIESLRVVKAADVVIALDSLSLENMGRLLEDKNPYRGKLYGIGATARIVHYIENEIVDAVIAYNDFALGYLGVVCAANALDGKTEHESYTVDYELVDSTTIFSPKQQRFLFEVR